MHGNWLCHFPLVTLPEKGFTMTVPEEIIQEIAQTLDTGQVVHLHKGTHEILAYPKTDDPEFDYLRVEVHDVVDADPDSYYCFEPPTSRESFLFMEAFAGSRQTDEMRAKLLRSLQAKRPFRSFREAVEWEGLLDDWYAFKAAQLTIMVRDELPD